MRWGFLLLSFSLIAGGQWATPRAAETAFNQHQFQKALSLWSELFKKQPENISYGFKTAELTFLLEGRGPALALLEKIKNNSKRLSFADQEKLEKKRKKFLEAFLSEEAQTFFLQAASKTQLKEWGIAWNLIRQANTLESSNVQILDLKKNIEKHLGKVSEACATVRSLEALLPSPQTTYFDRVECELAEGHYEKVKESIERVKNPSFQEKLALLDACIQTQAIEKAGQVLESIKAENGKSLSKSLEFHWLSFQYYSKKQGSEKLAAQSKKRLLALASIPEEADNSLWDPFQVKAQLALLAK